MLLCSLFHCAIYHWNISSGFISTTSIVSSSVRHICQNYHFEPHARAQIDYMHDLKLITLRAGDSKLFCTSSNYLNSEPYWLIIPGSLKLLRQVNQDLVLIYTWFIASGSRLMLHSLFDYFPEYLDIKFHEWHDAVLIQVRTMRGRVPIYYGALHNWIQYNFSALL